MTWAVFLWFVKIDWWATRSSLQHLELGEAQEELLRLTGVEGDGSLGIVAPTFELVDDTSTKALVQDTTSDSEGSDVRVLLFGNITSLSTLDEDTARRSRWYGRSSMEDRTIGEVRGEISTSGAYGLGTIPRRGMAAEP